MERARCEPNTLVVGIDANAASMRDAARRASKKPLRGGRPNALFVVAAAEALEEFARSADEAVVQFPWGSLLDGVLGRNASVLRPLALALKPGATLSVLVSIADRDRVSMPTDWELRDAYRSCGLKVVSIEPLMSAEALDVRSSWGRRLGAGRDRTVTRIVARRPAS